MAVLMTPRGLGTMKGRKLRTLLTRELGYNLVRSTGSHKTLECPGRPSVTFAFHDGQELAPSQIWKVLVRDVGLTEAEALEVLRHA